MPEGDSIYKIAGALRPMLEGQRLERVEARGQTLSALVGQSVKAVAPRGKHLVIELEDGSTLRTHLGMRGKWHRYQPGEPWQKSEYRAHLVLATNEQVFVCFDASQLAVLRPNEAPLDPALRRLGPDVLADDFLPEQVLPALRSAAHVDRELGDLLLDQSVACGLGNAYKSELLYLERIHPWTPPRLLEDEALTAVYALGAKLMRQNLGPWMRTVTADLSRNQRPPPGVGRFWVYRRRGHGCYRCRTRIQSRRQGEGARMTYWCPRCQPDPR